MSVQEKHQSFMSKQSAQDPPRIRRAILCCDERPEIRFRFF
jgi:hypothetical protein